MKKLIMFNAICIIISILFSCGSDISITKRHYNNGYYISCSEGKQTVLTPKEEGKVVQTKTMEPLVSVSNIPDQNTKGEYSVTHSMSDNHVIVSGNERIQRKAISQQNVKLALKQKTKSIKIRTAEIKHNISETKKISRQSDGEGLSLFWIVILVILLLWALGFLAGGFGGLINLLLLVALILLILWLFRII